jgi:hypothetical protein
MPIDVIHEARPLLEQLQVICEVKNRCCYQIGDREPPGREKVTFSDLGVDDVEHGVQPSAVLGERVQYVGAGLLVFWELGVFVELRYSRLESHLGEEKPLVIRAALDGAGRWSELLLRVAVCEVKADGRRLEKGGVAVDERGQLPERAHGEKFRRSVLLLREVEPHELVWNPELFEQPTGTGRARARSKIELHRQKSSGSWKLRG